MPPTGVQILTNITPAKLKKVVAVFQSQGATVVVKEQADGKFTVTATFPKK